MGWVKMDNSSFNEDVVKTMTEEEFIKGHYHFRPDMKPDVRNKWLKLCYSKITGKKMKADKTVSAE